MQSDNNNKILKKLVYIGAGSDPSYLNAIDFDVAIAIDPRPNTEFPTCPDFITNPVVKERYVASLIKKYDNCGFKLNEQKGNIWYFSNGTKQVIYHTDISFPDDLNDAIINDISDYNILLIKGYMPDKSILQMTTHMIHIIGSDTTGFLTKEKDPEHYDNTVDWQLLQDSSQVKTWTLALSEFNDELCENIIYSMKTVSSIHEL